MCRVSVAISVGFHYSIVCKFILVDFFGHFALASKES